MTLYNLVMSQFKESVEEETDIDKNVLTYLSQPKHEIITNFPVRLDNNEIKLVRIQKCNIIIFLVLIKVELDLIMKLI